MMLALRVNVHEPLQGRDPICQRGCEVQGQRAKWKMEGTPTERAGRGEYRRECSSQPRRKSAQRGARRWTGTGPTPQSDLAVRDCKYIIRGRASRHPRRQAMMRVVLRLALDDWKRWNIPVQRREHGAAQSGNDH